MDTGSVILIGGFLAWVWIWPTAKDAFWGFCEGLFGWGSS